VHVHRFVRVPRGDNTQGVVIKCILPTVHECEAESLSRPTPQEKTDTANMFLILV